jgi:hypothetical protein
MTYHQRKNVRRLNVKIANKGLSVWVGKLFVCYFFIAAVLLNISSYLLMAILTVILAVAAVLF